ncbi:hypothetical protein PPL_10713 [Heterostelium album PN500]|uniref:F-box domain-containing protein n=1 Tax=Heterostelium pallidum (strain ATCC 26659 / Pp 5 / PN500) TaxID=670386 RepID=D3BRV1_HETP5|nr:hypothetical protein PPL_10713 [Heterostelium album PN500]EFA76133.1 hypothetical protein PPL_10713 [Heterostelium album PN500]|eukprot:XP_020428267.1 hypothetical protein PPL_10713 [Heterostelium album PN500]
MKKRLMIRLPSYILEYIIRLALNLRALTRPSSRHDHERPFNYREMQQQQQHYSILINTINIASVCKKWREIVLKNLYILELNPYVLYQLRKYNASKNNAFIREFDTDLLVKVLKQFPSVKSVHLSFFHFVRSTYNKVTPSSSSIPPLSLSQTTTSLNNNHHPQQQQQQQQQMLLIEPVSDYAPVTLLSQSRSPVISPHSSSIEDRINLIADENEIVSITCLEIVSCVNFRSIGFVNYLLNSVYLKTLVIDHCNLRDSDCSIIVHAIKSSSSLKSLSLRRNQLQDEGGKAISVLIEESPRIAEIYLSNNMIAQNGTLAITNALKRNQSLTHLSLDNNYLSMDSALSLIHCFSTNKTLKQLDIRGNYFQSRLLVEFINISIPPDVNILLDNEVPINFLQNQQSIKQQQTNNQPVQVQAQVLPQYQSIQLSPLQQSPRQSPILQSQYYHNKNNINMNNNNISSSSSSSSNNNHIYQHQQQQQIYIHNLNNLNKHTIQHYTNNNTITDNDHHHYLFNYNNNSFFNNSQLLMESKKRKLETCK